MIDVTVSKLKRFLSYIIPIKIWSGSSDYNPYLELHYVSGHYRLSTIDAIYSDGSFYRPLALAFNNLKKQLSDSKSMLVLGAGVGSAIEISNKYSKLEFITLVDIDEKIIEINKQIYSQNETVRFESQDAGFYVQNCKQKFDLIVIDVFQNQQVPDFILTVDFLENCKKLTTENASVVLNYIISDKKNWEKMHQNFNTIFPKNKILQLEVNRILIATI